MSNHNVNINMRVFLAIANRRVVRAEGTDEGCWQVETTLDGPAPVTLTADPNHPERRLPFDLGGGLSLLVLSGFT